MISKIKRYLGIDGQTLYLIAYCIYLLSEVLSTTMFPISGKIYTLCKYFAVVLIGCKILKSDKYTWYQAVVTSVLVGLTVVVRLVAGYSDPFLWIILLIGAKDVPFDKIIKIYFVLTVSVVMGAFMASNLSVIENLQYRMEGRGIRNSFGIVYPTDFASHVFYLMIVFFFLKMEKLKSSHYIMGIAIASFVYYFCNTRLDTICMLLAIVLYFFVGYLHKRECSLTAQYRKRIRWTWVMQYAMLICATIMVGLSVLYNPDNRLLAKLDGLLNSRLMLGHKGIIKYGFPLFGRLVEMIGNGSTTTLPSDSIYFFIDCSYLYTTLQYGLIFGIVIILIFIVCCRKYKYDDYFLVAIALVSVNCMVAHHLMELAYNPFPLAFFASVFPLNGTDSGIIRKRINNDY